MAHPLTVSVVIPAYRAAGTIARALHSVLAQHRRPEQIVVVDDGSPDNLASALAGFAGHIELVRKDNGGAASARNAGIAHARGELIAFLDADDYWEPAKLETQLNVLRDHPSLGLIAGRFFQETPGQDRTLLDERRDRRRFGWLEYGQVLRPRGGSVMAVATRVLTSAVLVRRSAIAGRGFASGLETAEDRDLWMHILRSWPAFLIPQPLVTHVLEPGSLSRGSLDRDFPNMLRVVRRHGDLLGTWGRRRWEANFLRLYAGCLLADGQPYAALKPAMGRLWREPWSAEGWWVTLKSVVQAAREGRRAASGRPALAPVHDRVAH